MKKILSLFLLLALLAPMAPAQDGPTPAGVKPSVPLAVRHTPDGKIILEDGTGLRLRLTRSISSSDMTTGDRVDFEVMDAIVLDRVVVVPQGSIAWATVTEAEHKKSMGRAGKLNFAIVGVKLANGEKANLRAVRENKGGGHVGAMTGAMVATAIIVWPAAPLFLFMHGKDVRIPAGTEITAYVDGDKVFEAPVPAQLAEPVPPVAAEAAASQLALASNPAGADIEIDGAFVGNTPSTLSLAPGDHVVRLTKKGYQPYERKLHVTGGKISLNAELETLKP
jgi:hypothetical protein